MAKKYEIVKEEILYLPDEFFEVEIVEVIKELTSLQNKYSNYNKLYIEIEYDYDYGNNFCLMGERLETDEERSKRLENEKKEREKKNKFRAIEEEKERSELARLKAKYEKG